MIQKLSKRRDEEGFTLIELLIVIIILGILAAIVVFAIGSTRKDSVTNSCKTDAKAIQLSLEAQKTTGGGYPAVAAPGAIAPAAALANGPSNPAGALLKSWPGGTAPATDNYTFTYTGTASSYTVTIGGAKVTGGTFSDTADLTPATACNGT